MLHALGRGPRMRPSPSAWPQVGGRMRVACAVAHDILAPEPGLALREEEAWDAALGEPHAPRNLRPPPVQLIGPEKPVTGRITPAKLARLSALLRMPVTRVETLLQRCPPDVQQLEPQQVAQRLGQLCSELGLRPRQAVFMVVKQPAFLLLTPLPDIHAKVAGLAAALGVPPGAVLRAALTVPSILARRTDVVQRRVQEYGIVLRCSALDVLRVLARGHEYLSATPASVRRRMGALCGVLGRPRCTVAAMLQARPDLVCMSPKVMNTKVNGLMSILNKQKRLVVTLLVKTPALLRCDLDRARAAFGGLQALLGKREGFVFAMVCHAPHLLLFAPRGLHQRCSVLRRCLASSPDWAQQFGQLRPPAVAQLVLNRHSSLSCMMYLLDGRRAGEVSLEQLLEVGPGGQRAAALRESWPDFEAWMERRRQRWAAMRGRRQGGEAAPQPVAAPAAPQPLPLVAGAAAAAGGSAEGRLLPASPHGAASDHHRQQLTAEAGAGAPSSSQQLLQLQQHALRPGLWSQARSLDSTNGVGPAAAANPGASHAQQQALQHAASTSQPSHVLPVSPDAARPSVPALAASSSSGSGSGSSVGGEASSSEGAADRSQQPGASTSGRPPSWRQLQEVYRRELQLRARARATRIAATAARRAAAAATVRLRSRSRTGRPGAGGSARGREATAAAAAAAVAGAAGAGAKTSARGSAPQALGTAASPAPACARPGSRSSARSAARRAPALPSASARLKTEGAAPVASAPSRQASLARAPVRPDTPPTRPTPTPAKQQLLPQQHPQQQQQQQQQQQASEPPLSEGPVALEPLTQQQLPLANGHANGHARLGASAHALGQLAVPRLRRERQRQARPQGAGAGGSADSSSSSSSSNGGGVGGDSMPIAARAPAELGAARGPRASGAAHAAGLEQQQQQQQHLQGLGHVVRGGGHLIAGAPGRALSHASAGNGNGNGAGGGDTAAAAHVLDQDLGIRPGGAAAPYARWLQLTAATGEPGSNGHAFSSNGGGGSGDGGAESSRGLQPAGGGGGAERDVAACNAEAHAHAHTHTVGVGVDSSGPAVTESGGLEDGEREPDVVVVGGNGSLSVLGSSGATRELCSRQGQRQGGPCAPALGRLQR